MPPAPDAALAHYPGWAQELARKYLTKTINQFVLHGNVRDLVPTEDDAGRPDYVTLRQFLANDLFAGRDVVVFYDRSAGLQFASREAQADFARALSGYDSLFGTDFAQKLPKRPRPRLPAARQLRPASGSARASAWPSSWTMPRPSCR